MYCVRYNINRLKLRGLAMTLYKFEVKKSNEKNEFAEFDGLVLYEPNEESAWKTALGLSGEYGLFDSADYTIENIGEFIEFAGTEKEWREAVNNGDFIGSDHEPFGFTTEGVALCCGVSKALVRRWAAKNGVESTGTGNRKVFLWQEKDLFAFAARDKKVGKRAKIKD